MLIKRDRRTLEAQVISGARIAGAMVATLTILALLAIAHSRIVEGHANNAFIGWLLISAISVMLFMTVQYWCRWFFFLPGYVMTRLALWGLFGWFSAHGYILVSLLPLMAVMTVLSLRYSNPVRIRLSDRVVLMSVLTCFLGSLAAALSKEPKVSALILGGLGDSILLVQWIAVGKPSIVNHG